MEDFYAILECQPDSTQEEIKSSFQKLALKFHPDKLCASSPTSSASSHSVGREFVQINKAWKVLGDDASRKEYDARWTQRCIAQDWPIQEDVSFDDFDAEPDTADVTHECRCGGVYRLTPVDVSFRLDIVTCESCSLCIRVLYNDDEGSEDQDDVQDGMKNDDLVQSPSFEEPSAPGACSS